MSRANFAAIRIMALPAARVTVKRSSALTTTAGAGSRPDRCGFSMATEGHRRYASLHQGRGKAPVMTEPGDEIAAAARGRGRLRASHADREQAIDVLKAAFVQGRLDKDEFNARVGQAFTSRTYAELGAVTADIPAGPVTAPPPLTPARAQARSPVRTSIKAGVCVIVAGDLLGALRSGLPWPQTAALIVASLVFACIVAGIVAVPVAAVVKLESRHRKRSGGQPPPRSGTGTGGQASPRPASARLDEEFPQAGDAHQHTTEAARSERGRPRSSGSEPTVGWRSRGRRYAIGYACH